MPAVGLLFLSAPRAAADKSTLAECPGKPALGFRRHLAARLPQLFPAARNILSPDIERLAFPAQRTLFSCLAVPVGFAFLCHRLLFAVLCRLGMGVKPAVEAAALLLLPG